ncbi:MAG: methyltransferase domain-containing protein [Acidimicrobiia bacterium]|nr:methyltransferase domain-containing protein [Acidimicrobiia bacterium]
MGPAYLRNAFTKGTEQEVSFLVEVLELSPGSTVLDVGCGPGRHSLELARRGIRVTGVDLSERFLDLAREAAARDGLDARFVRLDVRELPAPGVLDGRFDAAICLCQGGFGLLGGDDAPVVAGIAACVRPGGRVAITAFHSYFAVRGLEPGETFEPTTGVLHETAVLRDEAGRERDADLWTTCFTSREMALVASASGLEVDGVYGVAPGRYGRAAPSLEDPEVLLLARRR